MLPQRNGLFLQSPLKILSVLVFHLLLTRSCKGQSQLISSSQPIVAKVGEDVILPCHLEPAVDVVAMTLEWKRPDLNPVFVLVRRAGQDLVHIKHPSYTDRTSVVIDELKHGNISLKLSKVKPSDAGTYQCFIPKLNKEAFVKLVVASGVIPPPVISLSGIDRNRGGVGLQCASEGWYPEPEVFWLDSEGHVLSAGPTETVRGPDGLYTVSSRVTVEKRHRNNFTCRVQQKDINQIRETQIHVPDDFFQFQPSSTNTVGFAVSLAVCILVILVLAFFVWRLNRIKTKRNHRVEMDELKVLNMGKGQKKSKCWPVLCRKDEPQGRLEAESKVQDLNDKLQNKSREVEKLEKEKERSKNEWKKLQEELENKMKELQINLQTEDNKRLDPYKRQTGSGDQLDMTAHLKQTGIHVNELLTEVKLKEEKQRLENKIQEQETIKALQSSQTDNTTSVSGSSTTEPVVEVKVDQQNKRIHLKNISTKDQELKGWTLQMWVNKKGPSIYPFEDSLNLHPRKTFTISGTYSSTDGAWEDLQALTDLNELQVVLFSNTREMISVHQ